MSDQPTPSDSSHLELGFLFCTRMMAMNPIEPSVPIKPEIENVIEISTEDEEFLSTPVIKKGK